VQLLRDEGWKVADPSVFIFGVGGSIYKCTRDILTSTFQLPKSVIDNLVHKLQRHALEKAQQIVATRRFLERSTQQTTPPHLSQRAPGRSNWTELTQEGTQTRRCTGLSRGHTRNQSDPLRPRTAGIRKRIDRKGLTGRGK
jgi:hypothetical protein